MLFPTRKPTTMTPGTIIKLLTTAIILIMVTTGLIRQCRFPWAGAVIGAAGTVAGVAVAGVAAAGITADLTIRQFSLIAAKEV